MRLFFAAILAFSSISFTSGGAHAQLEDLGFALNRFDPAERGSDWFALDSLDLRGDARTAVGLTADYARKPLVFRRGDEAKTALIDSQLMLHAAANIVFVDRIRLGLSLPFAPLVTGNAGSVGADRFEVEEGPAMGDMRLSADVRLAGEYGDAFTAALGAAVWLPTGNYRAFSGDGKARVGPRLALAGKLSRFEYAARLGYNHRARDEAFATTRLGSELTFGGALGVRVTDALLVGPELYGSTIIEGKPERLGTAVEAVLGVHYTIADTLRIGVGAGPGLSQGLGSPELRGLFSIGWMARDRAVKAPVDTTSDRDRDRVPDYTDACPDEAGSADADPPGCPLADGDEDGIADAEDSCPFVAGVSSSDSALHGCPSQDTDKDGVLDGDDACPEQPGRATADHRTSGCADSDGDSVFDSVDACPGQAGVVNLDASKSGCPVARATPSAQPADGPVQIAATLQFGKGDADIDGQGRDALERVRKALEEHPEVTLLAVEGHTDPHEHENDKRSMRLSKKRVSNVLAWLTRAGIDPGRLAGTGFGAERPATRDASEQGRAQNRRVDLHVIEINNRPVDAENKE